MPVGDCERAFGVAARRDGLQLIPGYVPGVTNRGHLDVPSTAPAAKALQRIFDRLAGDEKELALARGTSLPADFLSEDAHVVIEIDEQQHFTSDRLLTLQHYPPDVGVAFSVKEFITLCEVLKAGSDRYRASKEALGFRRPGGRRAQRAYFDAVRDLAAPLSGWRVFRVAAAHGDGQRAYNEVRSRLRAQL